MSTIENVEKHKCCGCTACKQICPKNAIEMIEDNEGFLYPQINKALCVNCGICFEVCKKSVYNKYPVKKSFGLINDNKRQLKKSSSGGASAAIANKIIAEGGAVYGVIYNSLYQVVTERLTTVEELEKLYGSKYVQTNPQNTLIQVLEDLKNGKKVAYFGTSCHIAGLLSFLKQKKCSRENLLTIDLICHGTPSPKVFASYIDFLKEDKHFKSFEFRTKHKPWGYGSKNFGCTINTATIVFGRAKTLVDTPKTRIFLNLFFSNNCLRPKCHSCNFAGIEKPADITIADYWGCKVEEPNHFTEDGVSAILVHSEKGEKILNELSQNAKIFESSVEKIAKKQGNLNTPSPESKDRDVFWKTYNEKGFMAVARKYGGYNFLTFCKQSRLAFFIRKIIKRG